jgi:hypothetical protein
MKLIIQMPLLLIYLFVSISCSREEPPQLDINKVNSKAEEALKFCKKNNLDTTICILIDMSRHSGQYRFFVYNLKKGNIEKKALVSHGCCSSIWSMDFSKSSPKFSNVDGSHCSSLGKYKIGSRGWSNWGININYQLHGLEQSNSNALRRQIVLHSWEQITDSEIFPSGTSEGWGCPAVSNSFMKELDEILKSRQNKVLMWIYN